VSFDLTIPYLGTALDLPSAAVPFIIQSVCQTQEASCQGSNQQYSSVDECVSFLTGIAVGSWNRANSNSVICRSFHSILGVVAQPSVYCPAIGPSGGGLCVDVPYDSHFATDF
jgi:hypothetical protein